MSADQGKTADAADVHVTGADEGAPYAAMSRGQAGDFRAAMDECKAAQARFDELSADPDTEPGVLADAWEEADAAFKTMITTPAPVPVQEPEHALRASRSFAAPEVS